MDSNTKPDLDYEEILESMVSKNKKKEENIQEMARSKMDPDQFGVPSQKKFPLTDAKHVKSAIKFFNYVDSEHEEELAMNIRKAAKKYGVDIHVGKKNRLSKYCKPEEINESVNLLQEEKIEYLKKNSKVIKKPKKCPKCGSEMGIFIEGEPICKCKNKDCGYVAGVVCYDQKDAKKKYVKEEYNLSIEDYDYIQTAEKANKYEFNNLLTEASRIQDISERSNKLYPLIVIGAYRGIDENKLLDYSMFLNEEKLKDLDDELTLRDFSNYKKLAEAVEFMSNEKHLNEAVDILQEMSHRKLDPFNTDSIKDALQKTDQIKDRKRRSSELEKLIAHLIGALCAKLKYILGQLNVFDNEYQYDGYIVDLLPPYIESLETNDLYKLIETVQEHAFTKGIGKKSLSDVIEDSEYTEGDKGEYIYNLAVKVRKDLSNLMYMMKGLYKKRRSIAGRIKEQAIPEGQKRFNESYEFFTGHKVPEENKEIVTEKAKLTDDNPFNNDRYMTNIKFSADGSRFGSKVYLAINTRYREDAEAQLPYIEKSFNNVKKSYKQVLSVVCKELYNKYKINHGIKISKEQFDRAFYKNQLQNPIVGMKDDYGCVFTFKYSINQYIDGRILDIYIKTDMDGNAAQYAYEIEKDNFPGVRNIR